MTPSPTRRSRCWAATAGLLVAAAIVGIAGARIAQDMDRANTLQFVAWLAAMLLILLLGLRLPLQTRFGRLASLAYTWAIVGATVAVAFVANVALFRHDVHFDLTRERTYTPSPQAETVVRGLGQNVQLTYFYQAQDPNGRRAKELVEVLGRRNPHLRVVTVDPDKQPAIANRYGVRLYNAVILEADGRQVQVQTTDDRQIALGILRVLRQQVKTICFIEGHNEYSIDNFEFHTHFETLQAHTHGEHDSGVTLTEGHGAGRLRRSLEALGFEARRIITATLRAIPDDCAAVVDVNPRTTFLPAESDLLATYLAGGGHALLMFDLGFVLEPRLGALLAKLGIRLEQDVVVDPSDHYSTDPEMVAVPFYEAHPVTNKISLTFYPGVRALRLETAPSGVALTPLFRSSKDSYTRAVKPVEQRRLRDVSPESTPGKPGSRVLAAAVEGAWPEPAPGQGRPFRLIVVGDADFASNSFFPYMANSDLTLAMARWLVGEEQAPAVSPHVPVLPLVILTNRQMQQIFLTIEVALPLGVMLAGAIVWWRRR